MLYYIARGIARLLLCLLNMKTEGADKVPPQGPVIVAANHMSNWDPIMVGVALARPVHFMAKVELFNNRFLGKLLTALNAFPIKRGAADRRAIRYALDLLQQGQVLGIFPEGARQKVKTEVEIHAGIAMLALKSGAQVVPVACRGTEKSVPVGWFRPVKVVVGDPLDLESFRDKKVNSALMEEVSMLIMEEINRLLDK